jgi:hypothetical protein
VLAPARACMRELVSSASFEMCIEMAWEVLGVCMQENHRRGDGRGSIATGLRAQAQRCSGETGVHDLAR